MVVQLTLDEGLKMSSQKNGGNTKFLSFVLDDLYRLQHVRLALADSILRAKYLLSTISLHLQFYGCSATLISCDPVIAVTAAHCIPKVEQLY